MANGGAVTDLSPRWVVIFKKKDVTFSLKFNNVDEMVKASARATCVGYTVKTFPAKPPSSRR